MLQVLLRTVRGVVHRGDVVLFESRDKIGGNVQSLDVELDGQHFAVDLGY